MRHALLALTFLACSNSSGPENTDHQIQPGTYTLYVTGCKSCPLDSTPGFALQFRDGATVTLEVSSVTDQQATGTIDSFSDNAPLGFDGQSDLMGYDEQAAGGPAYQGTWVYASGIMTLGLRRDGTCGFAMLYPDVNFGAGTCRVR